MAIIVNSRGEFQKHSDPTPEEITERCAECQAKWSEVEEPRRRGWTEAPVETQVVRAGGLDNTADMAPLPCLPREGVFKGKRKRR